MKDEMFNELLDSVQEMDEIVRGENAAARVTELLEPDTRLIHEKDPSEPELQPD